MTDLRRDIQNQTGASWTLLPHAYGLATDAPGHLVALLDGSDDKARTLAVQYFGSAIVHQGTLWPASANALSWFVRVLSEAELSDETLDACLDVLTEAADYREQVDELPPSIPELSQDAERWLAAFATADDERQEELWEESFEGDLSTEIYVWIAARTELLRPSVAGLIGAIEARGPSSGVRAALLDVGGAWGV